MSREKESGAAQPHSIALTEPLCFCNVDGCPRAIVVTHAPREIATAVQSHIKALRLLGREKTSIAAIADALHLTDSEIETAFKDFKIVGAKIGDKGNPLRDVKTLHTRHGQTWSPVITLKK